MSYDNLSSVSRNVLKFYQQFIGAERRVPLIFSFLRNTTQVIVRHRICLQTGGQTNGHGETSILPYNFVAGGIFKQSWSAIPPISTKRTIASHLTVLFCVKIGKSQATNDESRTRLGELQVSLNLTISIPMSNISGRAKVKIAKNERDPHLFTGKLLQKFQNILRNTTQVILRHRVKIQILSAVYWWREEDPFHFWWFSLLPFQRYWTWYDGK
jgi:hypothetical protein